MSDTDDFDYETAFFELMEMLNGSSYSQFENVDADLRRQFYILNGESIEDFDEELEADLDEICDEGTPSEICDECGGRMGHHYGDTKRQMRDGICGECE
jgi:hypothetical protein